MQLNYFLNKSNSKWLSIGIVPASKLFDAKLPGFYCEVALNGTQMPMPVFLGGIDGFLSLCKSLRSFDELKFTYPNTASDYSSMNSPSSMTVNKRSWACGVCFDVVNNGEYASVAQNGCTELLRMEKLILISLKKLIEMKDEFEITFNDLVKNAASDLSAVMADIELTSDTFVIEVMANFNDLFKKSIENFSGSKETSVTASSTTTAAAKTESVAATPKVVAKKPRAPRKQPVKKVDLETPAVDTAKIVAEVVKQFGLIQSRKRTVKQRAPTANSTKVLRSEMHVTKAATPKVYKRIKLVNTKPVPKLPKTDENDDEKVSNTQSPNDEVDETPTTKPAENSSSSSEGGSSDSGGDSSSSSDGEEHFEQNAQTYNSEDLDI